MAKTPCKPVGPSWLRSCVTLSNMFVSLGYVCGGIATAIAARAIPAPVWVAAILTAVAPAFGHLATSPFKAKAK